MRPRVLIVCALAVVLGVIRPGFAETNPRDRILQTANEMFRDMPEIAYVHRIVGNCGADDTVNPEAAYCATQHVLYLREQAIDPDSAAYTVAFVLGHVVQIRHGVADIALSAIRARRAEEDKLRGWVTRQAGCVAGVIYGASDLPVQPLSALFASEPMTDRHWGLNPLSVAPQVSIGFEARSEWFERGVEGDLSACAVGEFSADLLVQALR